MNRPAWLLCALLSGCAYKVELTSTPAGAQLLLPDGSTATTPTVATLRWRPFGTQPVIASAPGYREVRFDLRRNEIRWFHYVRDTLLRPSTLAGAPRGSVDFLLVPEHGPAGSWTADEIP